MNPFLPQYPQLKKVKELALARKRQVYLIGGFVRDYLLYRPQTDFDFAVDRDAIAFARTFAKKIKGAFVLLDAEHGCARVAKKDGAFIWTFDFADYRAPSIAGDLKNRDFTVNTLAVYLNTFSDEHDLPSRIIDRCEGKNDIKAKTIRMVSAQAFKQDPLRVLRAFSLHAQLGFKIEAKTGVQIKKDLRRLAEVSSERVRDELFKILASPRAYTTLRAMDKIGVLVEVMPQIAVMKNVKQGGYHHLDVWPHSLETLHQLELLLESVKEDAPLQTYLNETLSANHPRSSILKLAALLHDIGKPETRKKEGNRMTFHGHEHVGRGIVRHIARNLKFAAAERHALEDMVLWHLRPGYLSNFKKPTDRAVFRYFRDTKSEAVAILLLSLADQRSTRGPLTTEYDLKHHEAICLSLIRRYFSEQKKEPVVRLITGHDLIRKLKLKPSPLFAKILRAVEEQQALGKIHSKDEALDIARKLASKEAL